ncbi:MAG: PAS domain-containing sensor histidine kinase [Gemmatimonadaceae bacterium]|nr:PAS domain-containing sensor histidine kinase [Gemmatimonadaceae bacterium]
MGAAVLQADLPIALFTPTGSDSRVAERILGDAGFASTVCDDMTSACDLITSASAGALLIAEEALAKKAHDELSTALDNQPVWSDIPIILLTGESELSSMLPRQLSGIALKGNVTLLERPVRIATLITMVRSALRARQRQLDVRDSIEERRSAERAVRESESQLRKAVASAPYPLMLHAEGGEIVELSNAWTRLTGYDAQVLRNTSEWNSSGEYPVQRKVADESVRALLADDASNEELLHIGERTIKTADGRDRTWDVHRVSLGALPDNRKLSLTAAIDVTAYKELVNSERMAREEAEEANAAKSRFLATMSHELRTPLNAISGYVQLIQMGVRGEVTDQQREDLDRINRSQLHLLALINDILNFAKIEAGHIPVDSLEVDVEELLAGIEEFVKPQLQEKNQTYVQNCNLSGVKGCGDADKVRQIMLNLLSNAIKFTPEGGTIELHCEVKGTMICIEVIDDGTGIPEDKLEAIFEPFVQVERGYNSAQHQGTGLGLSISRDLARRMEGDLTVASELGKGSKFEFTLPLA